MSGEFLTVGDAAMGALYQSFADQRGKARDLDKATEHSGAATTFAIQRFRTRWAQLGVSEEMTANAILRGQAACNYGVYLCDSPIEKILLPWLVFEDYGSQIFGPAGVAGPDDKEVPGSDLTIAPQFKFGRYRLDFAILVKDMKGARRIFAIECDGVEYHADEHADTVRDEYLLEWGVRTIRATGKEIHNKPMAVSARVADAVMGWCGT